MNSYLIWLPILQAVAVLGIVIGLTVLSFALKALWKGEDEKYKKDYEDFLQAKQQIERRRKNLNNGI